MTIIVILSHCCPVNLKQFLLQLALYLKSRVVSGVGGMNNGILFPSFRRRPESSDVNDSLDTGLRQHDNSGVNGTAVILSLYIQHQDSI
ncbi:MAG: hypothetical protein COB30_014265 [Ectothiorhodospiraceae bacterium]|nr:hypothetical protein [Ectothiorhodospiraceae bacterium]